MTDSTTHKLSDILPIALNLFKDNDAKSMKIQCDTTNGISVEINDGHSFAKSSKGMNKKIKHLLHLCYRENNRENRNVGSIVNKEDRSKGRRRKYQRKR